MPKSSEMNWASSLSRCFRTCAPIQRDTSLWPSSPLWPWKEIRSPVSVSNPTCTSRGTEELSVSASEALIQLGPAEEGEQPEAEAPLALAWNSNKPGPVGPHCLDSLEMDHSGGMVFIFYMSTTNKLGLSLFGRGFEKRHAWGRSLAGFNHLVFGSGHLVCRVHHGRNGPP